MSLESTDIDAKQEELAGVIRSIRAQAANVKTTTNRAASQLSQLTTDYAELIDAITDLEQSGNPVDQLQVAKMAKMVSEARALAVKINAVKSIIDANL